MQHVFDMAQMQQQQKPLKAHVVDQPCNELSLAEARLEELEIVVHDRKPREAGLIEPIAKEVVTLGLVVAGGKFEVDVGGS